MKRTLLIVAVVTWVQSASALDIQLDYSYDVANGNFFGLNPTAKAAVDAAALALGNAVVSTLGAITTDIYSGTNGSTTATFDWSLEFGNPATGVTVTQNTFSFAANSVTVYVGMQPLTGITLGQGGPGGGGFSLTSPGVVESQWVGAVAAATASSNAAMTRGGGPIITSISGSAPAGATTAFYTLNRGMTHGALSFDNDTDNDTFVDTAPTLAGYWHYDHTAPVAVGKNDLYSVALHELIHTIGFGSSATWTSLHSGTTWTGANVISLAGTGVNILSADQAHVVDSFMSTRVSDGVAQEAVMDPSITVGTRKNLTQVDLAFLRDLGYQTIPEPSAAILLGISVGMFGARRVRRRN